MLPGRPPRPRCGRSGGCCRRRAPPRDGRGQGRAVRPRRRPGRSRSPRRRRPTRSPTCASPRAPPSWASVSSMGHHVLGGARHGRDGVDGADLGHPLAVGLLSFGQAPLQLVAPRPPPWPWWRPVSPSGRMTTPLPSAEMTTTSSSAGTGSPRVGENASKSTAAARASSSTWRFGTLTPSPGRSPPRPRRTSPWPPRWRRWRAARGSRAPRAG